MDAKNPEESQRILKNPRASHPPHPPTRQHSHRRQCQQLRLICLQPPLSPLSPSLSPSLPPPPPLTTLNSPIQWRGKRAIRIGPLLPLLLQLGAGNVTTPFCIISTLIGPYRPAGVFRGVPSATILSLDVYFLSFFLSLFLSGSFCHIQWRPQRRDPDRILSQGWLRIPGKDHRWPIE